MIIDPHPPEAPRRRWPFLAGWSFAAITLILAVLLTHTPVSQQPSVAARASPAPSGSTSVSRSVVAPSAPLQASAPSARVEATPAPSPTRAPTPVPVHVVGTVVDDAGTGIPGVKIALVGLASTSTDDRGSFALTYETTAATLPLNQVTFTKEGFEPDEVRTARPVIDVRLRRVVSIPQNAAIRLTLDRLDGFCGTDLDLESAWRCRRVHLTSTVPGTLRVDAETDSASMGLQLRGVFATPGSPRCCWSPLQVHVARSTDVEIDVLWMDDLFGPPGPIDVALETSFVPDGQ